jgi:hypothetical protein
VVVGDVVGVDEVGDTDGDAVGDDVVGELVGEDVVGERDGDRVGESVLYR